MLTPLMEHRGLSGLPRRLACLVHLVRFVQPKNQTDRPHEQDRLAEFFSILLVEQDGIERGSVHMQAIGVLNETELLEPIHKETHS